MNRSLCWCATAIIGSMVLGVPVSAQTPPDESSTNRWQTSASVGLTLTAGNSDTLLITGDVTTERKWDKNEITLKGFGSYGENDDEVNNAQIGGAAQYNRLFTERLYGYLRVDALHDDIASVQYRVAVSPGVGYYFIKQERTTLVGELGPGYVWERVGHDNNDYPTLRAAERFEHKFSDRVRVWQSVEYVPNLEDFGDYVITGEVGIETAINDHLSLRVWAQDIYRSEPAAGKKENDFRLVAGLGYTF